MEGSARAKVGEPGALVAVTVAGALHGEEELSWKLWPGFPFSNWWGKSRWEKGLKSSRRSAREALELVEQPEDLGRTPGRRPLSESELPLGPAATVLQVASGFLLCGDTQRPYRATAGDAAGAALRSLGGSWRGAGRRQSS